MAECDKVVKYIDLPLQHAADDVLRRMKRPGTGQALREAARADPRARARRLIADDVHRRVSRARPTAEFEELCAFVRSVEFDHVGVFTYSHEEGTTAHDLRDDVSGGHQDRSAATR